MLYISVSQVTFEYVYHVHILLSLAKGIDISNQSELIKLSFPPP